MNAENPTLFVEIKPNNLFRYHWHTIKVGAWVNSRDIPIRTNLRGQGFSITTANSLGFRLVRNK